MKISMFGLGYVGCVSLGCLAKNGHQLIGVDLNPSKVRCINDGISPIVEAEIDSIIAEQHLLGNISATSDAATAVLNTDISFVCVGTPPTSNGHLDFSAIYKVSEQIGKGIREKDSFHVVVIRSTVLPGTNQKVASIVEDVSGKRVEKDFAVVSNPEFLREGSAVKDYYSPPYTLIGSDNFRAVEMMKTIYKEIDARFIVTDIKIAELIKYVNNAFHALKVTFANEVGGICDALEIDPRKLMDIFCQDTKLNISPYYLKPGFSYGGSCLPKDLKALRTIAHDQYLECPVLENIELSNELQKKRVCQRLIDFNKDRIGFLGLSFKGGTDDLRNSPIVDIIEILIGKGFDIKIYDKNVRLSQLVGANREFLLKKIPYISTFIVDDPMEIVEHSDVITVVNNEAEFSDILNHVNGHQIIYDLVNISFQERNEKQNYIGIVWK